MLLFTSLVLSLVSVLLIAPLLWYARRGFLASKELALAVDALRKDYARHTIREAVEFASATGIAPDKLSEYVHFAVPKASREVLIEQLGEDGYAAYLRQSGAAVRRLTGGL